MLQATYRKQSSFIDFSPVKYWASWIRIEKSKIDKRIQALECLTHNLLART